MVMHPYGGPEKVSASIRDKESLRKLPKSAPIDLESPKPQPLRKKTRAIELSPADENVEIMRNRQKETEEMLPEIDRLGDEYGRIYLMISKINKLLGRDLAAEGAEMQAEKKVEEYEKMNMRLAQLAMKNLKKVFNEMYGQLDASQKKSLLTLLNPAEQSKLVELQMLAIEEDSKQADQLSMAKVRKQISELN